MERVEIGNWTKTREVNEIEGEDKKLNSEEFDNIKNINMENNTDHIQILNNLYTDVREMKSLNSVGEGNSLVLGNKVLRTKSSIFNRIYSFKYETISSWVGSNTNAMWKEGYLGSRIVTWPSYVEILNDFKDENLPLEWRMIEGNFELSDSELNLIKTKMVQPVLGISTNDSKGFNFIIPFNDLIHIFIGEKPTEINYKAHNNDYRFKIDNFTGEYQPININENIKYCNREIDENLSQHTHNKHIDCNILKSTTGDNYYKMIGDISQYIEQKKNNYKISLLIGQLARADENNNSYGGGISKIDLFLIKNPTFDINIKPYIIKNNNKVYIDSNYKFLYNEKMFFDVEIINQDENYDYSNLAINIGLIKEIKNEGNKIIKIKDSLNINKSKATYNGKTINNNISVYLNDNNTPHSISELSNLKKGDKLIISSEEFNYTITEFNSLSERIEYDCIFEFNYLDSYTFYKYENTKRLPIKPIGGRLNLNVKSNKEDYFYLKLKGAENSANIKVKSNEPHTVYNLDYNKEYELSLINSSSYKTLHSQKIILQNKSGENIKSITINTNTKSNNYFTQRNIDEIIINR